MEPEQTQKQLFDQEASQYQLIDIEHEIAALENEYLSKTCPYGNLIIGFDRYRVRKGALRDRKGEKVVVPSQYRLFSLSSACGPVQVSEVGSERSERAVRGKKNHIRGWQVCQGQESSDQEHFVAQNEQQRRNVSRKRSAREHRDEEEWQWSVSCSYRRFGSLHRCQKPLKQAQKKHHTDPHSLETCSISSDFNSKKTDSLDIEELKRKRRRSFDNLSVPSRRKMLKKSASKSDTGKQTRMVPEERPSETLSVLDFSSELMPEEQNSSILQEKASERSGESEAEDADVDVFIEMARAQFSD